MTDRLKLLAFEVELGPGEQLTLPAALVNAVGQGRWLVTVAPAEDEQVPRSHDAFLAGYADSDEGLYDDLSGG